MADFIITEKQFRTLFNEGVLNISAQSDAANKASFSKTLSSTEVSRQINKADNIAGDVNVTVTSPETSNDMPTISVPAKQGETPAQALNNAGSDVDKAISNGCGVEITNADGVNESFLSVKDIKESRAKNLKRGCREYTKGDFIKSCKKRKLREKVLDEAINEVLQELSLNGGIS